MAKDTKRSSSDRRFENRRQMVIPVKLDRRISSERRLGIDRRVKPA